MDGHGLLECLAEFVAARRAATTTLWQHRSHPSCVLFFLVVIILAFLLGVFVPLANANAAYAIPATIDNYQFARDVCFWTFYLCFMLKSIPQLALNFSRGRSVGLHVDSVVWTVFSDATLMLSSLMQVYYVSPASSHANDRDAVFSITSLALSLALLAQCILLDGLSIQCPSHFPVCLIGVYILMSVLYLLVFSVGGVAVSQKQMAIYFSSVLYMTYICASLARFIPQIVRNNKYAIFIGYDVSALGMDIAGGAGLVLSVVFSCPAAHIGSSSSSSSCSVANSVVASMDKIVHGSATAVLALILVFHCLRYRTLTYKKQPNSHRSSSRRLYNPANSNANLNSGRAHSQSHSVNEDPRGRSSSSSSSSPYTQTQPRPHGPPLPIDGDVGFFELEVGGGRGVGAGDGEENDRGYGRAGGGGSGGGGSGGSVRGGRGSAGGGGAVLRGVAAGLAEYEYEDEYGYDLGLGLGLEEDEEDVDGASGRMERLDLTTLGKAGDKGERGHGSSHGSSLDSPSQGQGQRSIFGGIKLPMLNLNLTKASNPASVSEWDSSPAMEPPSLQEQTQERQERILRLQRQYEKEYFSTPVNSPRHDDDDDDDDDIWEQQEGYEAMRTAYPSERQDGGGGGGVGGGSGSGGESSSRAVGPREREVRETMM